MDPLSTEDISCRLEAATLGTRQRLGRAEKYDYSRWAPPTEKPADGIDPREDVPWASNARKYEWKEDYGDVGPEDEELEKILFRNEFLNRVGVKFDNLQSIKVIVEAAEKPDPISRFADAGLHPIMEKNVALCGYQIPTPIQAYAIPTILQGHDLMAIAQTGSGKTAAYLIPVLSKLMGKAKKLAGPRPKFGEAFDPKVNAVRAEPLVLVIVPTRELACQIFDEARRLCYRSMLRPCVAYGGGPVSHQRMELQKGCDILIGTPGRLIDFMGQTHVLSLRRVRYTIVDEADELLNTDWETEFAQLLSGGDSNEDADHRYMMFSATFNKTCRQVAKKHLETGYVRIRVGRTGSSHANIEQRIIYAEDQTKMQCLYDLLLSMPPARTLIFVNTKVQADRLDDYLFNLGLPSTSIHSDRTQREREDAMSAFRTGKSPILIATGVSARGLDIKNVMHVVNFDLPSYDQGGIDEYVHRIGRTARIGNEGIATSLYNHGRNTDIARDLVKLLLENKQVVPDFLEELKPEGELVFDDDNSDVEEDIDETNVDADPQSTHSGPVEDAPELDEFSTPKQEADITAPTNSDFDW
ncbi:DEAD/DEAH box RNA helicase, putative [Talaromyces stipitatus ATCC 10500]|uniref:RNA helicase n=1 Tax=Talaromyces stipitatus (strain ATCC 10500 / CBS 375.48 / QM 6759 / NRRL 1006) TaxID=441959 RepID=B8MMH1_TALSN|nr:DEAD/DEAH box RNA helicase, putative [Talaromyces stipitatus ATCC 10500]EED13725.1 DEAD/DEAH box RNA helicase, putative [Talaromyces stipitatus ATCC 10500]